MLAKGSTSSGLVIQLQQPLRGHACAPTRLRSGAAAPPSPSIMWQFEQYLPMMSDTTLRLLRHLRRRDTRPELPHVAEHRPRLSFAHPAARRVARSGRDDLGISRVRDDPLGIAPDANVLEQAGRAARGMAGQASLVLHEGLPCQRQRPPHRRIRVCGRVLVAEIREHDDAQADDAEARRHERPLQEVPSGRRSRNGSRNSKPTTSAGITIVASGSSGPGKYFSN